MITDPDAVANARTVLGKYRTSRTSTEYIVSLGECNGLKKQNLSRNQGPLYGVVAIAIRRPRL